MRSKFAEKIPDFELRLLRDFQREPTKSIKELAEAVGVPVLLVDMPAGKTAYLSKGVSFDDDSGYVIYVNKRCSKEEMRWAVAHELGHYFLHRGNRGPFDGHFNLQSDLYEYFTIESEEWEANNFAEDLFLAPTRLNVLSKSGVVDADAIARSTAIPKYRVEERLRFLARRNMRPR